MNGTTGFGVINKGNDQFSFLGNGFGSFPEPPDKSLAQSTSQLGWTLRDVKQRTRQYPSGLLTYRTEVINGCYFKLLVCDILLHSDRKYSLKTR